MHQKQCSRVHWMIYLGICFSQMLIARASPVTASIIAPSTTIGNETDAASFILTSSSSANKTLYVSTLASNTATDFVVSYSAIDLRTTLGNETIYSPSIIETSSKGSSGFSASVPDTTQLTIHNISAANETSTRFYVSSTISESPALSSSTETTSTPKTISTPKITSSTGTMSTPEITATSETTSTPEITSTSETTSTTQCTSTTTKTPKKDCVIDDADLLNQLRQELRDDEGCIEEIYNDTTGHFTFGIGHKITPNDPEYGWKLGTHIPKERIEEAFSADVKAAIVSCCNLFDDFQNLPNEVQLIILNMAFNLGHSGLGGFKKFREAVNNGDWDKAADEMVDSKWYRKDVPNRAKRLVERMRKVAKMC